MGNHETSQAVRDENRRRRASLNCAIQYANPVVADRMIPPAKIHALPIRMAPFPACLPMLRPRIPETRQDQNRHGYVFLFFGAYHYGEPHGTDCAPSLAQR